MCSDDENSNFGDDFIYQESTEREIHYLWAEVEIMYKLEKTLSPMDVRSDITVFIVFVFQY